ncbi:hypothetical protein [Streptomyces sp. TLI_105]|uniref:hypothetical protein n=1 Tax=Streptomyces sp. TLI_105 TaxID=1881019 RepID=UPI000899F100|nr:hypothetical protein [Streptomyces sp. TLI_105]SED75815.1 hypothetical protein SAMN05428939_6140 [Streptomyces sp. TLI_105]
MSPEPAHPGPVRHHDHGTWLVRFTGRILVACPRCGGRALVTPRLDLPEPRHLLFEPRRLTCGGCGAVAEWAAEQRGAALVGVAPGGTEDPFFRRPLWLQTRCAGRVLWAYDEEHVDALAAYVGARLRHRHASPTLAMFARLPAWMKSAARRDEVLAGLAALRALARRSAPADRSDAAHERADRPRHHGSVLFRGGPYWSAPEGTSSSQATPLHDHAR